MLQVSIKIANWKGNTQIVSKLLRELSQELKKIVKQIIDEAKATQASGHDKTVRFNYAPDRYAFPSRAGDGWRYFEKRKPPTETSTEFDYPKIDFTHEGYVDETGDLRSSIKIHDVSSGLKYTIYITSDSDYWYYVEREYGYKVVSHAIYNHIGRIRYTVKNFCQTKFKKAIMQNINDMVNKKKGFSVNV